MPLSENAPQRREWLYGVVAAIAVFELAVFTLLFMPDVSPAYAAFYLDKSTTCLDRTVPADLPADGVVSFRPEGRDAAMRIRVCGWSGPAGDGTHSVGEQSRLRMKLTLPSRTWMGRLDIEAIANPAAPLQRVIVRVQGVEMAEATIPAGKTLAFDFTIPANTALADGTVDIELGYPDAVRPDALAADTKKRAIKLRSLTLTAAGRG